MVYYFFSMSFPNFIFYSYKPTLIPLRINHPEPDLLSNPVKKRYPTPKNNRNNKNNYILRKTFFDKYLDKLRTAHEPDILISIFLQPAHKFPDVPGNKFYVFLSAQGFFLSGKNICFLLPVRPVSEAQDLFIGFSAHKDCAN